MEQIKKVLLVDAHLTYPNWAEGKLNESFLATAKQFFISKGFDVLETEIEAGYVVEDEVGRHLDCDIVILQTPVNWFGAPWIYKKYVDEVFNAGLHTKKFLAGDGRSSDDPFRQYGTGGKLHGKKFMICGTWNAPAAAFSDPEQVLFQGRSVDDLFLHITSNYLFCGFDIMPSYNTFDIFKNPQIEKDLENYPKHLAEVFGL
jgi:modulator of drug activity B